MAINPFISMGVEALGGLLAGRSRKKAADQIRRDAYDTGDLIVQATREDQARAIEYKQHDQKAIDERGALGIDFKKLVRDAQKAGFNPLTALAATGGAGYDRPGILTTPFLPMADAFASRANLVVGAGPAQMQSAGYFGDVLAGLGSNLFRLSESEAQRAHEFDLMRLEAAGRSATRQALPGTASQGGFMGASNVTMSPTSGTALTYGLQLDGNFPGRPSRVDPVPDMPMWMEVEDGLGNKIVMPNSDMDMDLVNLPWIVFGVPPQYAGIAVERLGLKGAGYRAVKKVGDWISNAMPTPQPPVFANPATPGLTGGWSPF